MVERLTESPIEIVGRDLFVHAVSPRKPQHKIEFSPRKPSTEIAQTGLQNANRFLNITIITWNLHGDFPTDFHVEFFRKFQSSDLIFVTVQEYDSPRPHSELFSQSCRRWKQDILNAIGEEFQVLSSSSLWSIYATVFVKREVFSRVSQVVCSCVRTGVAHVLGNKGGIGISFCVDHTISILFIGSHLAAHQQKVNRRNQNFAKIDNKMMTTAHGKDRSVKSRVLPDLHDFYHESREEKIKNKESTRLLASADYVFWAGDLNYRVNISRSEMDNLLDDTQSKNSWQEDQDSYVSNCGSTEIIGKTMGSSLVQKEKHTRIIRPKSVNSLLEFSPESMGTLFVEPTTNIEWKIQPEVVQSILQSDQLTIERCNNRAFHGFLEGQIRFRPTYKYDVGKQTFDSSNKQRIPAWTDRILFKVPKSSNMRPFQSNSLLEYDTTYGKLHSTAKNSKRDLQYEESNSTSTFRNVVDYISTMKFRRGNRRIAPSACSTANKPPAEGNYMEVKQKQVSHLEVPSPPQITRVAALDRSSKTKEVCQDERTAQKTSGNHKTRKSRASTSHATNPHCFNFDTQFVRQIQLLEYDAVEDSIFSDHRPVFAQFQITYAI